MKSLPILTLATLAVCLHEMPIASSDKMRPTKEGINDFGLELFRKLLPVKNGLVATIDAVVFIRMLYFGAEGKTAEQIEKVLRLKPSAISKTNFMNPRNKHLKEHHEITSAFGLYVRKNLVVRQEFIDKLKSDIHFSTIFQSDDNEAAKKEINSWLAKATRGKITEMTSRDFDNVRMSAFIAGYQKLAWNFTVQSTYEANFVSLDGRVHENVKFMKIENQVFKFYEDDHRKYLVLPCKEPEHFMLLIIPSDWQQAINFNSSVFESILEKLQPVQMRKVAIPLFSLQQQYDLKDVLIEMGLTNFFDSSADFSGIRKERDIWMSSLLMNSVLEVTETSAVAVETGEIHVMANPSSKSEKEFVANRPFVFSIVNMDVIISLGRLLNPLQK